MAQPLHSLREPRLCGLLLYAVIVAAPANSFNESASGARATPRSVMMAVTYLLGVTSNAGFSTSTPSGAICFPA